MQNEDPWSFDKADYPADAGFSMQAASLLALATLAPSGHNTQPWLFRIGDGWIDVIADRRRALPVVDPYDRELAISCGAAVGTLEIAARYFGYVPTVSVGPDALDDDLLARVKLVHNGAPDLRVAPLFEAITARRTTRATFSDKPLPDTLREECISHAKGLGVGFDVFTGKAEKHAVAALVAEGDRMQFDDPAFRRELASWVHSSRHSSRDGMSGAAFGMPDILSPVGRYVIRTFDLGGRVAASDATKIVDGTPALGVLSTAADDQRAWVNTGRALSRVLLALTAGGFMASYLNQPIETPILRPKLQAVAGEQGFPQILIRMGQASEKPPATVRRPVADLLV